MDNTELKGTGASPGNSPGTDAGTNNGSEIIEISDGFAGVLQILANKMSKKGAVIALSMVLIYLLSATPVAPQLVFSVIVIGGLGVFYTILQWIIDRKRQKTELKIIRRIPTPDPQKDEVAPKSQP
jgi:hypothetical protein